MFSLEIILYTCSNTEKPPKQIKKEVNNKLIKGKEEYKFPKSSTPFVNSRLPIINASDILGGI